MTMHQLALDFTDYSICPWCGETLELDVLEYYPEDHHVVLWTCCEGLQAEAMETIKADPRGFARWFETMTDRPARQGYNPVGGHAALDFGLTLAEIPQADAKAFVRKHHRHCPPPAGWRWGHAVYNGSTLIAVAMVGRPVARKLDHTKVVEVNRLCVDPTLDSELVWNACSMLYAAAAKEAKRRGFERIVTYTLESETGGTLVAAGWTPTVKTKGGSWSRKGRQRTDKTSTCKKQRWERGLTKKARNSPSGRKERT